MSADLFVHNGLGEGRLIRFVMPKAPVAKHVDDNRLMEFLPELYRDPCAINDCLGVIAIHMKDGSLDHLCGIRGIGRGARVARSGRKADLVVDDKME